MTGQAVVTGTVTCSRAEQENVGLVVTLAQAKKGSPTAVQGSSTTAVQCRTVPQAWSVTIVPQSGVFTTGNATATARTSDTPTWVKPASASKAVQLAWKK